jgi:xylulokinase
MASTEPLALGIDVGTTAVKAVALDGAGRVAARADAEHEAASAPRPGWAEADPAGWWRGVAAAVRALGPAAARVGVVGVSGMVPALVLLDAAGRVLRPAIQQNDARTAAELAWLAGRVDPAAFLAATGQPLSQQLVPPRLLWLRAHEPGVYARIARVLGSYDWITHRLTGAWSLERNWALEAGFWDAGRERWYAPMLEAAGVDPAWLPPLRAPHEIVGRVTAGAAAETGLPAGTPVVAGSADHVAAALAAGTEAGELVLKLGGSGDVLYGVDRFAPDPRLYLDYHDLPGRFLLNGCMAASGLLLGWLAGLLAPELAGRPDRWERLDAEAAAVPPGSDGIVLLPYLLGEKTPIFDPTARGAVTGLSLAHGRGHLHRAALEAVAHGFRHHVEVLAEAGRPITRVRLLDRGARSPLWRQIVADVLDRPIEYAAGGDLGSAHGTALVAGVALGGWDWAALPRPATPAVHHVPAPAAARVHDRQHARFRALYERLAAGFWRTGRGEAGP